MGRTSRSLLASDARRGTKALLIGEPARVRAEAVHAYGRSRLRHANGVLTVQLGVSHRGCAQRGVRDALGTTEIERCVNRIEAAIKRAQPDVSRRCS
jgi:hypothetical protein